MRFHKVKNMIFRIFFYILIKSRIFFLSKARKLTLVIVIIVYASRQLLFVFAMWTSTKKNVQLWNSYRQYTSMLCITIIIIIVVSIFELISNIAFMLSDVWARGIFSFELIQIHAKNTETTFHVETIWLLLLLFLSLFVHWSTIFLQPNAGILCYAVLCKLHSAWFQVFRSVTVLYNGWNTSQTRKCYEFFFMSYHLTRNRSFRLICALNIIMLRVWFKQLSFHSKPNV